MKKIKVVGLVIGLIGIFGVGNVMAADADLTVTAEVDATCTITAGTLDFGVLDPTSGDAATVTNNSAATVTCTSGQDYTLSDDDGVRGDHTLSDGTNTIAYTLAYTTSGTGDGTAENISIQGDIAFSAYQTKPAGTYTDTVVLTVSP